MCFGLTVLPGLVWSVSSFINVECCTCCKVNFSVILFNFKHLSLSPWWSICWKIDYSCCSCEACTCRIYFLQIHSLWGWTNVMFLIFFNATKLAKAFSLCHLFKGFFLLPKRSLNIALAFQKFFLQNFALSCVCSKFKVNVRNLFFSCI